MAERAFRLRRGWLTGAAVVGLGVCLGACLLFAALQWWANTAGRYALSGTRVCTGVVHTVQGWYLGVGWEMPRRTIMLSWRPSILSSNKVVCVYLPLEISRLPAQGDWMFPP